MMTSEIEKKICDMHREMFFGADGRPSILLRLDRLERPGMNPKLIAGILGCTIAAVGAAVKFL